MLYYERKVKRKGYNFIIGVDEAGRGPLAGPVVAAAVNLKSTRFKNRIDDSKKLTPRQRENAFEEIATKSIFGLGVVSERLVDQLNILVATRLAMEQAVRELVNKLKAPHQQRIHILVDGNVRLQIDLPFTNIIGGDGKSKSIACASILAKVTRDQMMSLYHRLYPEYGFLKNKGYPTKGHRAVLKRKGPSTIHRTTYRSV